MHRRGFFVATAALAGAVFVAILLAWRLSGRPPVPAPGTTTNPGSPVDSAVLARLQSIPLYGALVPGDAIRAGRLDSHGVLHLELDVRAILRPRLAAAGLSEAADLFPAIATGTIGPEGPSSASGFTESWSFKGPAGALELLDRRPSAPPPTVALKSIPGAPTSLVSVRLSPGRLGDPDLGGAAFATWRDRASFAEKLLGRPVRAEIAEDISGPAVFALYEGSGDLDAEAILAVELRRSDRIAELLEMVFGLGALTERAKVVRYRGVATGSFAPTAGGAGFALAVDGPILFLASSRARLESAIDARRDGTPGDPHFAGTAPPGASWSAMSSSKFVRRGWARLARSANDVGGDVPNEATTAALRPEGAEGWRLDGHGPGPAISADPVVPYLRSVLGKRQR